LIFFDLLKALSVYLQFTLAYTTFWLMIGVVLLRHKPRPYQLSVLAIFLVVVLIVYFTNWDSRKAFLKDFNQIEVGMTMAQVDQLMKHYLTKSVGPTTELNDKGEIIAGTVSYRHTLEGWGNADIGVLTFESGRVVQDIFYPD
jgi:hypothetical protein